MFGRPSNDLFQPISDGDVERVRELLDSGADMDAAVYNQFRPLHWAVKYKQLEIVSMLLDRGADVNVTCVNGRPPLYFAIRDGFESITERLLDCNANVNIRDILGVSPAALAYNVTSYRLLDHIVARMDDVERPCSVGMTPIASAVQRNNIYLTKLLINRGAKVNYITALKSSVLFLGCSLSTNNAEMVEIVLKGGANPNELEPNGSTAFHYALEHCEINVIRLLIKYGASLDLKTLEGRTPLHSAVLNKHLEIIKILLDHGADINATTNRGTTVLEMSFHSRSIKDLDVIEYLLWRGADYRTMYTAIMCMPLNFSSEKERIVLKRIALDDYTNRIDPKVKAELFKNPSMVAFHERCIAELDKLSQTKVNDGHSLVDILLTSDEAEIVELSVNCKIQDVFDLGNFPIHARTYLVIYSYQLEENLIRQNAAQCLSEVFDLNGRDHVVIRTILSYLTRYQLIHFSPRFL